MRVAIVVCVVGLWSGTAWADADRGKALSAEAETAAGEGRMVDAASKFRSAFSADPRPEYMCNVGVAYLKAPDLPRAHRYLGECLQLGAALDKKFLASVRGAMDGVESKLAVGGFTPVDFAVEPPGSVVLVKGGIVFDEPLVGSRRAWFPYGTYEITIHAEGYVDLEREITAADHTAVQMKATLERSTAPEPVALPPPVTVQPMDVAPGPSG